MEDKKKTFEFDFEDKHKPRDHKKKKKHRPGFSEDSAANRQSRIGFKNYLRELEEEDLDESLDDLDSE